MQDAYDKYLELIMFYNFLQEKLSLTTEKNIKNQFFNFKMEMLKAIQKFRESEQKLQEAELDYLEFSDDFLKQKQQTIDELKRLLVKTR